MSQQRYYTTQLQAGLGLLEETRQLLQVYQPGMSASQLYEAALEGILLFLILRIATHRLGWLQRRGGVAGLFMLGYGLIRVSLENVRQPDVGMPDFPFGLTMGMILSIPMILIGAWLVWRAYKTPADQ